MPIYEYECLSCGHRFEHLQRVDDPPLTTCSHCGQNSLKKCVSLSGFRLEGKGWYSTDYKEESLKGDKTRGKGKPQDSAKEQKVETPAKKDDAKSD